MALNEPLPPRSPLEVAEVDARVELEQSIVPGAHDLYSLTKLDLDTRWQFLEDGTTDSEVVTAKKAAIAAMRMKRTQDRIRTWALDPEGEAARVAEERVLADDNIMSYLFFGESPEDALAE